MSASNNAMPVPADAVFVAAGEALLVFPSAAEAEGTLPALDVLEGVCSFAYGIAGERYRIRCDGDRVRVERTAEANHPDELKALLLRHLEACEDPADATQSLDEIVAIAWEIERDFQVRCGPAANRFGTQIPVWSYVAGAVALGAIWYFGFR